jgi:hypothetical protein
MIRIVVIHFLPHKKNQEKKNKKYKRILMKMPRRLSKLVVNNQNDNNALY